MSDAVKFASPGSFVRPVVGLDSFIAGLSREGAIGDRDRAEALVAGTVDDGDGRAVLDCAVVLGFLNAVAGDFDLGASALMSKLPEQT